MNETICKLRIGGDRAFFFIFDGEGEVMLYHNLAKRLPEDFTVYGIMPTAKINIPLASLSIEEMASNCLHQIKKIQPTGTYYIGGLCAGGLISYEVAVQLENRNDNIGALLLLEAAVTGVTPRKNFDVNQRILRFKNTFAKSDHSSTSLRTSLDTMKIASMKILRAVNYQLQSPFRAYLNFHKKSILNYVLKRDTHWPSWQPPLKVSEIYGYARDQYKATSLATKNALLIKSTQNITGGYGDEPVGNQFHGEHLGWNQYIQSDLHVLEVTGGHTSMLQEPYVDDLAKQIKPFIS